MYSLTSFRENTWSTPTYHRKNSDTCDQSNNGFVFLLQVRSTEGCPTDTTKQLVKSYTFAFILFFSLFCFSCFVINHISYFYYFLCCYLVNVATSELDVCRFVTPLLLSVVSYNFLCCYFVRVAACQGWTPVCVPEQVLGLPVLWI